MSISHWFDTASMLVSAVIGESGLLVYVLVLSIFCTLGLLAVQWSTSRR